jgi:hypothetical protein
VKSIRMLVVAALVSLSLGSAGVAFAQSSEKPPGDHVKHEVIHNNTPPNQTLPEVLPRGQGEEVAPGVLPFTGSDLALFVVGGLVAIAAGITLVRRYRTDEAA